MARPPGDEGLAAPPAATAEAAGQGVPIHESEWRAFSLHIGAEATLRRPTVPPPEPPDAVSQRALIENDLGIPELELSLVPFGTPPVAPPAHRVDRDALERDLLSADAAGVSPWKISAHRSLRKEARIRATQQAHAEDERMAAEQSQLQQELDDRWAELRALRHRAAQETEKWTSGEMRRREAVHDQRQAAVEDEWRRQADADPAAVTEALRATFTLYGTDAPGGVATIADGTTTVVDFLDGVVVLTVACLDRDDLIVDTEPVASGGRRRGTVKRSQARRNELYLAAIASRVLSAVARALSTTPAVESVACIAVRASKSSTSPWEAVYCGTFRRGYAERLLAEGRWTADPDALIQALEDAEEVELELTAGEQAFAAPEVSEDPGVRAVIDRMNAAVRSDDAAARESDHEAVRMFLRGSQTADDGVQQRRDEELVQLQRETDTADEPTNEHPDAESYESPRESPSPPAEMAQERSTPAHEARVNGPVGGLSPDGPVGGSGVNGPGEGSGIDSPVEGSGINGPVEGSGVDSPVGGSGVDGPGVNGPVKGSGVDPLSQALQDSDGSVRRAAVEAIGRRNSPTDTALLLKCLSDPDDIVRLEAMYALKDRMSSDMRRDTIIAACGDRDETVRRKAIEALADLGDERDTPVLQQALKDPADSVRLEAIYAIKHRLSPDMRDALIDACADSNDSVRRKAIAALAELGDERDTPLLLKALQDSDSSVRLEAIYALEGRSGLGSATQLSEPLLEAMKADDAVVRQAAVRLFGRL